MIIDLDIQITRPVIRDRSASKRIAKLEVHKISNPSQRRGFDPLKSAR